MARTSPGQEGSCGFNFEVRALSWNASIHGSFVPDIHSACCVSVLFARLNLMGAVWVLFGHTLPLYATSICLEEADQREGISGRGSGMDSDDIRGVQRN